MAVDLGVELFCDSETGALQRPIAAKPLRLPDSVELDGDRLIYSWKGKRIDKNGHWRRPGRHMLDAFVKLGTASEDRILAYARKWGPLHLCKEHGWPLGHVSRKREVAQLQPGAAHGTRRRR